ncbi:glycosyl hydrolase family 28 protein [Scytonema sp. PRP1]|uniref:glycosyl hydrolase family 28 protein n=1 Tax=Scytonema sp. PRP1 TaxID=3120513 RepID=UPI002FD740E4
MPYTDAKNIRTPNNKYKLVKPKFVFLVLMFLTLTLALVANASLVVSQDRVLELYPTPMIAQKSNTYAVSVNGKSVFVNKYNSINYVHFAFAGTADIEISYKEPIKDYTLSPKSAKIPSRTNGKKISFSLKVPRKLILHKVNGLGEQLYILADPLEDNAPQLGHVNVTNLLNYNVDSTGISDVTDKIQQAINEVSARKGVLYIPPGVYKTKQLNLKSNMTLYLAGGAVLEATKEINPSYGQGVLQLKNVSNVKIMGRGELYGHGSYWRPRGGWYSMINMSNVNDVVLEDIIIRDPAVPNVWIEYAENCSIYNAKILAEPEPKFVNTDGFDIMSSRNITVDNVLYKGTDDATAIGGDKQGRIQNTENINIRNSVFYSNNSGGAGFTIGARSNQDFIRNITYENVDVVHVNSLANMWAVTRAKYENIYFKNIRLEDVLDAPKTPNDSASLFNFRVMVAIPQWEPTSSPNNLGSIKNVYFKNLLVDDKGGKNSIFQGYDSERGINKVTFDNFYIKGKLVTTPKDAFFSLIPSDKDGKNYVKSIDFTQSNPTIVNITANKIYASKAGDTGEFIVTRTGGKNQALRVKYTIRGTAKNGRDYKTISHYVTIPPGAASAKIPIQPIRKNKNQGLKTVFLSLENLPNTTEYMLGSNFHAVANIGGL